MELHYSAPPEWLGINDTSTNLQFEQLITLLKVEKEYSIPRVSCHSSHGSYHKPLQHWRHKICHWSFRVIDHFHLDREIVSVGMHILDRFLAESNQQNLSVTVTHMMTKSSILRPPCACYSCKRFVDSEFYQLAAMTCIYLAIKLHIDNGSEADAAYRRTFKLQAFCELSRGLFVKEDLIHMEQTILRTLNWKVASTPTPMTFVNYYLAVIMPDYDMRRDRHDLVMHVLRELSRYLTELVVCVGEECMHSLPSQVGFAALRVAMDLLTFDALPDKVRSHFCGRIFSLCEWDDEQAICRLQAALRKTLWPEMLLVDCMEADSSHPIRLARDHGILDKMLTSRSRAVTPPKQGSKLDSCWGESPVSVANAQLQHAYHIYP